MNVIVTGNSSVKTVAAIIAAMRNTVSMVTRKKYKQSGNSYWLINGKKDLKSKNTTKAFNDDDLVINYGCATGIVGNSTIINPVKSINNMCDKYRTRCILRDAGIPVPKTGIQNLVGLDRFPIIARKLHHSRGTEFIIFNNSTDYGMFLQSVHHNTDGYYFSSVYQKQRELRVHVAHGKVLLIHEKGLSPDDIRANHFITGEEWRVLPWSEYELDVCKIAVDAVKAVGASFGAVDVMINRENTTMPVCVCEINSAPSFENSEYTVSRYAKYFDWVIRKGNPEWWPYETYTKGKSFSWKNVHLNDGVDDGDSGREEEEI